MLGRGPFSFLPHPVAYVMQSGTILNKILNFPNPIFAGPFVNEAFDIAGVTKKMAQLLLS
jgi:hypothetical protein